MEVKIHGQDQTSQNGRQEGPVLPHRGGGLPFRTRRQEIGTYDPLSTDKKIVVDAERANYWLANGAQPTDTVRVLLKKAIAAE